MEPLSVWSPMLCYLLPCPSEVIFSSVSGWSSTPCITLLLKNSLTLLLKSTKFYQAEKNAGSCQVPTTSIETVWITNKDTERRLWMTVSLWSLSSNWLKGSISTSRKMSSSVIKEALNNRQTWSHRIPVWTRHLRYLWIVQSRKAVGLLWWKNRPEAHHLMCLYARKRSHLLW